MFAFLAVGIGIIAAFAGVHYGRRGSAIGIGICLAIVVVTAIVARMLLAQAGRHAWQLDDGHPWTVAVGIGMLALVTTLGLIGPALFARRWMALAASAIVVVGFVATQLPLLYAGCTLYGACP